jgi:hypothetical protein
LIHVDTVRVVRFTAAANVGTGTMPSNNLWRSASAAFEDTDTSACWTELGIALLPTSTSFTAPTKRSLAQ